MKAILIFLAMCGAALAHGDAQWISDGGYVGIDSDGHEVKCCGISDCRKLADSDVLQIDDDDWRIVATGQVFVHEQKGLHDSEDGWFWGCMRYKNGVPIYHCLFVTRTKA